MINVTKNNYNTASPAQANSSQQLLYSANKHGHTSKRNQPAFGYNPSRQVLSLVTKGWDRVFTYQRLVLEGPRKNIREIDPDRFYTGPSPANKGINYLAERGIGVIINLKSDTAQTIAKYRKTAEKSGIDYHNFPVVPNIGPSEKELRSIFGVINKAEQEGKKVYVHCMYGKDRTGLIRALYRVKKQDWPASEAYKEWVEFGYSEKVFPLLKSVFNKFVTSDIDTLIKLSV